MGAIVLDSDNSELLSDFYQNLLGWKKRRIDEEWIVVSGDDGKGTPLLFQQVGDYQRPAWPNIQGQQQQMMHLDFYVEPSDLEKEINHAIACGAKVSEVQFSDTWKVMIDPAGHPFCIIPIPPEVADQYNI